MKSSFLTHRLDSVGREANLGPNYDGDYISLQCTYCAILFNVSVDYGLFLADFLDDVIVLTQSVICCKGSPSAINTVWGLIFDLSSDLEKNR